MSNATAAPDPNVSPALDSRRMLRRAAKAVMATLDSTSGHPYASLVAIATEPDGAPILLLSRLALHTKNLEADSRASLLIESPGTGAEPLARGRVTLIGQVRRTASMTAERRFLAVHPTASGYARFADFGFFVLQLERAHYVGGFGRICSISRDDLLLDVSGAGELIASEPDLIAAVARDESRGLARLGARLSGGKTGEWRVTGIDPAGCDLALGSERHRCEFPGPVANPGEAWRALRELLDQVD